MKKSRYFSIIYLFLVIPIFLFPNDDLLGLTKKENAKIFVGPNVLVSRDGEFPHVELMVAANPKNPKNFIGTAITFNRRTGNTACKVYASNDNGYTWVDSSFAEQLSFGGGDPQVAFGLNGTAYFCALAFVKDESGRTRAALHFYRSEDGGFTWFPKVDLGYSYDHEQIVVDHSFGKYAGRIYIATLYGYPEYQVGVFRSDDDGRTFVGPVKAASGLGKIGINCANILVLSDGTLFVPYIDFPFLPEDVKKNNLSNIWFVLSQDGGVTFSSPRKIGTQIHPAYEERRRGVKAGNFIMNSFPAFAVDISTETYKDRLYAVWSTQPSGNPRIIFSYSKDRGITWSEPKPVSPEVPEWASQYLPEIAVNNKGVVGIQWYDTRASEKQDLTDLYFTVSVDGGESFLPPVRVTSVSSKPASKINLTPSPMNLGFVTPSNVLKFSTLSAYSRWGMGGDYVGLVADSQGIFHPFWADSREKTFQIWTCPIRVELNGEKKKEEEIEGSPQKNFIKIKETLLDTQVKLYFDPVDYDPQTKIAHFPVRLQNISKESIYPPLIVRVKGFVNEEAKKYAPEEEPNIPEIIYASNGEKAPGAEFDYSMALRDFDALEPGALTEAIEWKFKFTNYLRTDFYLEVEVTGSLMREEKEVQRKKEF